MRKAFVETASDLVESDERTVLLLGDIGVFGFSKVAQKYPKRVINIGILEQSMIGTAAGLSMGNLIPIVHTIAPFVIERAYEQIKIDFGYQKLSGNIVSVGSSFDYAALGATHHCPADVSVLLSIPNIEIFVPGTSEEFDSLFRQSYSNDKLSYFRLSETSNSFSYSVKPGKANVIKSGKNGLILVWGPMIDHVLPAAIDLDVTVLYFTSARPIDYEGIRQHFNNTPIISVEPFYEGTMSAEIVKALDGHLVQLSSIGVPRKFIHSYGTHQEQMSSLGLDTKGIRNRLISILGDK